MEALSSERKACETLGLQETLAFGNNLGWRSDAIRANHFQSFGYTSEGFQEFLGLESVLVEEVRVPSGVARSWAWCRSCLNPFFKQTSSAVGTWSRMQPLHRRSTRSHAYPYVLLVCWRSYLVVPGSYKNAATPPPSKVYSSTVRVHTALLAEKKNAK